MKQISSWNCHLYRHFIISQKSAAATFRSVVFIYKILVCDWLSARPSYCFFCQTSTLQCEIWQFLKTGECSNKLLLHVLLLFLFCLITCLYIFTFVSVCFFPLASSIYVRRLGNPDIHYKITI